MIDRRSFLQHSAWLMAGTGMASLLQCAPTPPPVQETTQKVPFGIQLYTLRDQVGNGFKALVENLASFGYTQIESFEGPQGFLWGMEAQACRQLFDDLGLRMVASHCDINTDFERKIDTALEMGMDYLICPYIGPQSSLDDFKKWADVFNEKGKQCKEKGIRFAYHNHDYSFKELEGQHRSGVGRFRIGYVLGSTCRAGSAGLDETIPGQVYASSRQRPQQNAAGIGRICFRRSGDGFDRLCHHRTGSPKNGHEVPAG